MSARQGFSRKAAIVGVGYTGISRESKRSVLELALEAVERALADAQLEAHAVDGLLCYHMGDSVLVGTVARALGIDSYRWNLDLWGGGTQSPSILAEAAMAIDAGLADVIVVYRALNGRSGVRMGQAISNAGDGIEEQFRWPYGQLGPVSMNALMAQHYFDARGITGEDLAALAVMQRAKASRNPKALLRQPITTADYFASPMISTPLRRMDCCLETDAAAAFVIVRADQARARVARPVYIHAAVRAAGPGGLAMDKAGEHAYEVFSRYAAPEVWRASGMRAADIDLVQLYDAYSYLVYRQLEDFGFCEPADIRAIVPSGRLEIEGELPMNTNGGLLHEGYVHGINNVVEAVEQLQGKCEGRQARDLAVALCTGFGASSGSAAILTLES
jgi:acetyl-CoA acetyltransferase